MDKQKTWKFGNFLTAFSTSFGLERQVPRPIWGMDTPMFSWRLFPKDIVCERNGEMIRKPFSYANSYTRVLGLNIGPRFLDGLP